MKWIASVINNQFLFYGFLFILCIGAIILFTMIYMDRKNIRSFKAEEIDLLKEVEERKKEQPEEIKITQITKEPEENKKANLEEVLAKMQADLEKKEDVVAIFEQEQEEKAIISYQELLNSKNKNTTGANKELLSVIEQIESGTEEKEVEPETDDFLEMTTFMPVIEQKKFKTTDFISPIYGKVDNHIEYPKIPNFNEISQKNSIEVDKKMDFTKENEVNHNDAFLNALKEFRSHLE